jgi:hypothetical protein
LEDLGKFLNNNLQFADDLKSTYLDFLKNKENQAFINKY